MDWQQLLVHDGQAIVIATGVAIGFTAVVFYRVKSRWGMHAEDKNHKRKELQRAQSQLQGGKK